MTGTLLKCETALLSYGVRVRRAEHFNDADKRKLGRG